MPWLAIGVSGSRKKMNGAKGSPLAVPKPFKKAETLWLVVCLLCSGFIHAGNENCHIETFWVDLHVQNPLDTEITLTNLSVVVKSLDAKSSGVISVETIAEVTLFASEIRTVSLRLSYAVL